MIHSYKGSEDYGIDLHVEIFIDDRPTGLEFGIQVKTTERLAPKKLPRIQITQNNLLYMASKTYPTMIAVASKRDRRVSFTWIGELFTVEELFRTVGFKEKGSKKISLSLSPNYDLSEEANGIIDYTTRVKSKLGFWYHEERNRRYITNLYFDLHSALDALIEFSVMPSVAEFSEDQLSHKGTFTVTLVLSCYFLMQSLLPRKGADKHDPSLVAIIIFRDRLRAIITKLVPEEALKARENEIDGQEGDMHILPGSITEMGRNASALICVFRDGLRELSGYLAPWRDFTNGPSGLATNIIDFYDDIERD